MSLTEVNFKNNGYTYLPEFLSPETTEQLVTTFSQMVAEGQTTKDEQCPLSDSIHGAPVFDSLLEELLPNFEVASGKKLIPTYAYARIYRKGEVLKPHRDRPACEISATLMLGSDGTPWPIYMADGVADKPINVSEILMNPGDAVLYRGEEKLHWREAFKGEWQAQVFLHYVDANGNHTDQKYDGRKHLAHHKIGTDVAHFISIPDAVSPEGCPRIIAECEKLEGEQAGVGGATVGKVDRKIRDVKKLQLPIHRGIATAMSGIGFYVNQNTWQFDVRYADQCEFLKYDINGHYHGHIDTFFDPKANCRKLTVLLFLNDDFEGGRLYLQLANDRIYPPQTPGSVLVFPSFILHGVEPVTKGIRRSLVTWLIGPWFK